MGVYSDALVPYVQAGWPCVLPVPSTTKHPPPVGYTGAEGADPTPEQYAAWHAALPNHSVALRMPDGVIGIDVDHYDKGEVRKRGGDHIAELEERLGPLPPTWVSSARPAPSGIRFYRVPAGRYRTKLSDSIEIIQRHHRYAVVAPSEHATADHDYAWFQETTVEPRVSTRWPDEVPSISDLAVLPEAWVEHLREGATEAGPASAAVGAGQALLAELEDDDREPCAEVYSARLKALEMMRAADSGSRHDTATERVHHLVMLGAAGHPGVGPVLAELAEVWAVEIAAGEGREDEHARRALTSARKAVTEFGPRQVPADPCLLASAVEVAAPAAEYDRVNGSLTDEEAEYWYDLDDDGTEPARLWSVREVIGTHAFDPQAGLDLTLAQTVLERVAPAVRYAEDAESWLRRGPELWELAGKEYAATIVTQVAQLMPAGNPDGEGDEKARADRRKRFMTSASAGAIAKQMVALARDPGSPIRTRLADLDAEPWVFWAGGQAWDLRGTELSELDLDPGTPHLHAAALAPEWIETPHWDAYLAAVLSDPELRAWTLRVLSIGLTGYPDAALPILLGEPGVGKTSLVKLIMSVLGTYAHAADPRLLVDGNSHASIVYALKGRRLSFIDEGPRRGRWATERLKQLTGGGELTGNRMRENPITFSPTHTLVLTANDEPQLTDEGLRRRVRLIPFSGDPAEVRERRAALGPIGGAVWRREAPGILAQLMREAGLWLADPDSALTAAAPASVRDLAEEISREQDTVRTWVESETEPDREGMPAMRLYEAFADWCKRLSIRDVPSPTAWGRKLTDLGYPSKHGKAARTRPLRLSYGGGVTVGSSLPVADSVTTPVTSPLLVRDRGDGLVTGLVTGLTPNPSPTFPQVDHRASVGGDGCDGFTPVYPEISTTTSSTENQGKGEFSSNPSPRDRTTAPLRRSEGGDGLAAEPVTKIDDQSQDGNVAGRPPSRSRKAALTPEEKAARTEQARAKRAAAAEEKRLAAVAEANGRALTLPAVVDRVPGGVAVREEPLFEAARLVEVAMVRSGGLTVDIEHTGYPVGHRLHALRTIQLGDALTTVVFDGADPDHRAVARALFDRCGELGLKLHAHSATADLIPLAHAGVLDAA
ncbi:phage/plasmid primase, P4 family [Actinophytocola sp. NPDC049390]|uniref:phage/plasmid primase, P4 family n=1 Tax=Actinophytocola sp. NPDC049390 TaxID=3363894 RepID=UPI0037A82204